MIEAYATGIRLASIILWSWFAIRILLYSWHITEQPLGRRQEGWRYWRIGLLLMSAAIVFLFSPADILRANGYIGLPVRLAMMAAGATVICLVAALWLFALDVARGQPRNEIYAYLSIPAMTVLFSLAVR